MANIYAPGIGIPTTPKEMLSGLIQTGDSIRGTIDYSIGFVNAMTKGMSGLLPSGLVEVPVFGEGQENLLVEKNTGIWIKNYLAMVRPAMGSRR